MKIITTLGIVSVLAFGLVSSASASIDKNLKYGQKDKEVTELQEFLISKGLLKTTPSSYFGLLTFNAVKVYQTNMGVSPTGFVGTITREKINKEITGRNEIGKEEISTKVNTDTKATVSNIITATDNNKDSIYDSSTKIDKDGNTVTITDPSNYKISNVVKATRYGISGFYYKDKKLFLTDKDLDDQAKATQDAMDKEFGRGIYASQSATTTSQNLPSVYVTPTSASFSGSGGYHVSVGVELRNTSDKVITVNAITYKIVTSDSYEDETPLSIKIGKLGTVLEDTTYKAGDNNYTTYSFQRPITIFAKESINLNFEYQVKIKYANFDSSESRLLLSSVTTSPDVKFVTLPVEIKAILRR